MDLLADATTDVIGWGQVAAQLGVAGILGWYLYFTTSVTFPNISKTHLERVDAICSNHDKALNTAMDKFTDELKSERVARREELTMISQSFICRK